ncbi:MAG: hypothetical protein NWE76_04030, partial [Candidatus Bathyarchaeota archaeon]|nr:hypothetical protein [Candidatus Bathyarchaeota archaeon]
DLQNEVKDSVHSLQRLSRLEQALQGKYLDFRISPSLEGINFVFDRTAGDPVLYKTVARPARPQAHGQDLTFVFAPLKLEARETYRLILVGDSSASFSTDDEVTVEIRINPGEGYGREPMFLTSSHQIDGHRNFAFDFRAPDDVLTISDIRVSLRAAQPIRSAILYVRSRLMGGLSSSSGLSYSGQEELSRTRVSTDKGSGKFRADSERETKPTQTPASPSERVETGEGGKTAKTPPRRKRLS